ncbi:MAG: 30S ribosome-binding factor RbfA [Planctomycetota bacterium]|nr:30S ribosome-binding factor RbfA [Planctomycetota bacterium]
MSIRKAQIESALRRAVSEVLSRHGAADPRIVGLVSVTRIDVSPDLHQAQVYVSVIPERHQKRTIAGLRAATRFIQGQVSKAMTMKTMPHLEFRLDETLKKEAEVFDAIRRGVHREGDLKVARPPADSGGDAEHESESKTVPTQDSPAAEDRPK